MNRLSIISRTVSGKWSVVSGLKKLCIAYFLRNILIYFVIPTSYFLLPTSYLYAKPYHTITVDGDLSDWSEDEAFPADSNDSVWAGGNEIEKIYLTWDKDNIYFGVKGQSNNTGLLMYFDFKAGGFSDLTEINTWNRKVIFQNKPIDCFYGSWSQSDGNFYEINTATSASDISVSKKCVSGWEFAVPFDMVYKLGAGKVSSGASVSLFASIVTGDMGSQLIGGTTVNYGYLGGDCAPDNNISGIAVSTITAFLSKTFDSNSDGVPDDSYPGNKLGIRSAAVSPNPFSPDGNGFADAAQISFNVTKPSQIKINVYEISGRHIKNICDEYFFGNNLLINKSWDGKNDFSETVAAGIYLINITATAAGESARKNLPVAVIK